MWKSSISCYVLAALLWATAPAFAESDAYKKALMQGHQRFAEEDYRGAIKAFKKAHKQSADSFECCFGLARAYNRLGGFKDAAKSARQAVAAAPDAEKRLVALNVLGVALFANGNAKREQLQEAVGVFEEVLEQSQLNIVRYSLGLTLLKLKRDAEGVAMMQQFLVAAPEGPEADRARAYIDDPRRARLSLMPDFDVVTLSGERLTQKDVAGKVVLFDFWGTWCGPCIAALPHLRSLNKRSRDNPFMVLSISNDTDGGVLRDFIDNHEMVWPQVWDEDKKLNSEVFQVSQYPTFILVDHEGVIQYRDSGWSDNLARALDARVAKAIKLAKKAGL